MTTARNPWTFREPKGGELCHVEAPPVGQRVPTRATVLPTKHARNALSRSEAMRRELARQAFIKGKYASLLQKSRFQQLIWGKRDNHLDETFSIGSVKITKLSESFLPRSPLEKSYF